MTSAKARRIGFPPSFREPIWIFDSDAPLKRHPAYRLAKAGDGGSAVALVRDLAGPLLEDLRRSQIPADYFVAPHAREALGDNAIPQVLAVACAAIARADADADIVQISKVYHTGADAMERLALRPRFQGPVVPGKSYCLVDDVTNLGGTLAELADFIQVHGGEVSGTVVFVNAGRIKSLRPAEKLVTTLANRYGPELESIISISPEALTANEANYLIGFRSLDEIRNRLAKARKETTLRLRSKGVR